MLQQTALHQFLTYCMQNDLDDQILRICQMQMCLPEILCRIHDLYCYAHAPVDGRRKKALIDILDGLDLHFHIVHPAHQAMLAQRQFAELQSMYNHCSDVVKKCKKDKEIDPTTLIAENIITPGHLCILCMLYDISYDIWRDILPDTTKIFRLQLRVIAMYLHRYDIASMHIGRSGMDSFDIFAIAISNPISENQTDFSDLLGDLI